MTDEVTTSETSATTTETTLATPSLSAAVIKEERLYANKFKTVDELEKAYGNSVSAMVEKAKLEKEMERFKAPESYTLPQDLPLTDDHSSELKEIARNAGLTQEQFEKTAREMHNRVMANAEAQEKYYNERKTNIGSEKLNILTDYVEKNYPKSVRDVVLDKLIKDDEAMSDAMKDRDSRLNTQVPGVGTSRATMTEKYQGEKELLAAARAAQNPRDIQAKKRYLELAREVGHARKR